MFCSRCGQSLPEPAQACPHCGQPANALWQPQAPPPVPGQAAGGAPSPPPFPSVYAPSGIPGAHAPQGVGGALLFFCIAMTILWPIWVLSQYAMRPFHLTPFVMAGLLRLLLGIVAGAMLWARNAGAMILLRIYLILGATLAFFNLFTLFRIAAHYNFAVLWSFPVLVSTGTSLFFLTAVILYFSLSERVRATYGSKLFG